MRWLCLVVLAAACGRLGFDPSGGGGGGGGGGDASGDDGGGPGGEGGPPVDALISPGCGTTIILSDDFANALLGTAWTQVPSAGYTVSLGGGALHVAFPANAPQNTHAGIRQIATVDFSMTCAIAELTQPPASAASAFAYLRIGTPTKYIQIYTLNSMLYGGFDTGGSSGSVGPVPYDPVAHRFFRIRSTGNHNYAIEAGPSITQFATILGSEGGVVVDPSPASLEIGGSTTAAQASGAGMAVFASVTFLGP